MRRLRLASIALAMVLLLVGCGEVRGLLGGADEAAKWFPKAERVAAEAHGGSAFKSLRLGDDTGRARVGQLAEQAPKRLNPQQTQTLNELRALTAFYQSVDDAARAGPSRMAVAEATVERVARESYYAGVQPYAEFEAWLIRQGKSILKDVACDLAWKYMNAGERVSIRQDAYANGYRRIPADEVPDVELLAPAAAVDAIKGKLISAFEKKYAPAQIVDWFNYAKGLYGKADEVVNDGTVTIPYPNGPTVTRAFIYYVKICLALPSR
jgi:hypothetical protein